MQVSGIPQAQPKDFRGTSVSVGPSSWRSSSGSRYLYLPKEFGYRLDPFMFIWLANRPTYVQNISSEDIRREQQERAKDRIFLQENPEIIKKKHPVMKGAVVGTIATAASMFLTKGIEIVKDANTRKVNLDPVLILTSAVLGVLAGLAARNMSMPNARMERLVREEKSKQETDEIEAQK